MTCTKISLPERTKRRRKENKNNQKNYTSVVTKIHISDLEKQGSNKKNSYVNQVRKRSQKSKAKPKPNPAYPAISRSTFSSKLYSSPFSSARKERAEPQSESKEDAK